MKRRRVVRIRMTPNFLNDAFMDGTKVLTEIKENGLPEDAKLFYIDFNKTEDTIDIYYYSEKGEIWKEGQDLRTIKIKELWFKNVTYDLVCKKCEKKIFDWRNKK